MLLYVCDGINVNEKRLLYAKQVANEYSNVRVTRALKQKANFE